MYFLNRGKSLYLHFLNFGLQLIKINRLKRRMNDAAKADFYY